MLDWQKEMSDPQEFMESLKIDLFEDEVYVFTPKGEVKSLAAGATPLDFAYEVHTEIGHRCIGRARGRQDGAASLRASLRATSWRSSPASASADPRAIGWRRSRRRERATRSSSGLRPRRARAPSTPGATCLQEHLKKQGLPAQKITGSALLADVIREMGYRKADDFYIALGAAKISPKVVVNKVLQRLKRGEAADGEAAGAD